MAALVVDHWCVYSLGKKHTFCIKLILHSQSPLMVQFLEFGSRFFRLCCVQLCHVGMWEQHGCQNKSIFIFLIRVFKQTRCFHCRVTRRSKGNNTNEYKTNIFFLIVWEFSNLSLRTCTYSWGVEFLLLNVGYVGSSVCGHQCILWTVECISRSQ